MRYLRSDDETFTTAGGQQVKVKATLPMVGRSSAFFEVPCGPGIALDEVATRPDAYGAGAESSAYSIFEENAAEIFDARLDMGRVRKLRVPT